MAEVLMTSSMWTIRATEEKF